MGAWRIKRSLKEGIGECHICKKPADGPDTFQTRFCYNCFMKGMELEGISSSAIHMRWCTHCSESRLSLMTSCKASMRPYSNLGR